MINYTTYTKSNLLNEVLDTVHNFTLDDSKGCYVEVTHVESGFKGWFGVNLRGTDRAPYSYVVQQTGEDSAINAEMNIISDNGIDITNIGDRWSGGSIHSLDDALTFVCSLLASRWRNAQMEQWKLQQAQIRAQAEEEERAKFNSEQACKDIHTWFGEIKPE